MLSGAMNQRLDSLDDLDDVANEGVGSLLVETTTIPESV